jgi:hypothetical protein
MDDPTPRSKKDRETECVFRGSRSQARAPFLFLFGSISRSDQDVQHKNKARTRLNLRNRCHRLYASQHRNPRLPKHMLDFGFP